MREQQLFDRSEVSRAGALDQLERLCALLGLVDLDPQGPGGEGLAQERLRDRGREVAGRKRLARAAVVLEDGLSFEMVGGDVERVGAVCGVEVLSELGRERGAVWGQCRGWIKLESEVISRIGWLGSLSCLRA